MKEKKVPPEFEADFYKKYNRLLITLANVMELDLSKIKESSKTLKKVAKQFPEFKKDYKHYIADISTLINHKAAKKRKVEEKIGTKKPKPDQGGMV